MAPRASRAGAPDPTPSPEAFFRRVARADTPHSYQPPTQQVIDHLRVGLPLGLFHHLPDEESQHTVAARPELVGRTGVVRDDLVDKRLKGRDVLRVEDVWPVLKESLDGLEGPADVAIAKEILQAVLEDGDASRRDDLYSQALDQLACLQSEAARAEPTAACFRICLLYT